jgi:hypothetical protein
MNTFVAETTDCSINFSNFHDATTAVFTKCKAPNRKPDYQSESGSIYWNTGAGVIRQSNHWGAGIRSCDWFYGNQPADFVKNTGLTPLAGFCAYVEFNSEKALKKHTALKNKQIRKAKARQLEHSRLNKLLTAGSKVSFERAVLERCGAGKWATYKPVVHNTCGTITKITESFICFETFKVKKTTINYKTLKKA